MENCLKEGQVEGPIQARYEVRARGALTIRDWRRGKRRFLEAVRTPRWIVDILSIGSREGIR